MKPKHIVTALYPGCLSMDVVGPLEAFNYVNLQRGDGPHYQISLAACSRGPVETLSSIQLVADVAYGDVQDIDTLMIPGARTGDTRYRDCGLPDWLVKVAPNVRRIVSICSGAIILGEAGLLDNRSVTTHWMDSADLRKQVPRAHVVADRIYVRDGNIYSSGGVTAGIDLALALIEEDFGHAEALKVAKRMVVPLKRAGNQAQFSDLLMAQTNATRFSPLIEWLEANLQEVISVRDMAAFCSMSPRNFSRQFTAELAVPPIKYLHKRRLERAKTLLEQTDKTLLEIAHGCGFPSDEGFRRQFTKSYGVSPRDYRARFGRNA